MEADAESLSEPSLSPGHSLTRRQKKCDEVSNKPPRNRTGKKDQQMNKNICLPQLQMLFLCHPSEGVFCTHFWDGFLCWEETPAGTSVTKTCSDHPDLDAAGETIILIRKRADDSL